MDINKAKELLVTYVKQFETDAVIGLRVDRSKRELLRRVYPYRISKQAYSELIKDEELHESGTGRPGSPVIVVLGSKPIEPRKLSFPLDQVSLLALVDFITTLRATYEEKGWGTPDLKSEITKALEAYKPGRPY